jgi:hypothetical protein
LEYTTSSRHSDTENSQQTVEIRVD